MTEKHVFAAFVAAQRAFGPALKSHTNPVYRSRYADLSACIEAVIDALHHHGFALLQSTQPSEGGATVTTRFLHESGAVIDGGALFVPATKPDAHGMGSALTYARRYSLLAACGLAPEDDDGNRAAAPPDTRQHVTGPARRRESPQGEVFLNQHQIERIRAMLAEAGGDPAVMLAHYKVTDFHEILETEYQTILRSLSRKIAANKGG
jgi:hypothetical protein